MALQRKFTLGPVSTFGVPTTQLVTSFPSKSELALNLSTDQRFITFMGYLANVNALDISNSNTPNHVDATNPVNLQYQGNCPDGCHRGKRHCASDRRECLQWEQRTGGGSG